MKGDHVGSNLMPLYLLLATLLQSTFLSGLSLHLILHSSNLYCPLVLSA